MAHKRTTKSLAQRIDLSYFKQLYPLPFWRRVLTFSGAAAVLIWFAWQGLSGRAGAYNAGPLSKPHASLQARCESCHAPAAGGATFNRKVAEQNCLSCHNPAIHHAQQTFTPTCESCHVEHTNAESLTAMMDESCTQCHASLKTSQGSPKVAASIASFSEGHPEIAVIKTGASDPGTVKFNHQVHLKKDLRSLRGVVDLKCADCHRPAGSSEIWPYADPKLVSAGSRIWAKAPQAYMAPMSYELHCSGCHPLTFDSHIAEPAPHKEPPIVQEFVVSRLRDYIRLNPQAVFEAAALDPKIPRRADQRTPHNAAEWTTMHTQDADLLLWKKTCAECHTPSLKGTDLPEIPRANLTARWLTHASFDHGAHQMLTCTACHSQAPESQKTSDVLLPKIAVCQQCHHAGSQAADSRCSECHLYHDPTMKKPIEGKYSLFDFR